MPKEPDVIPHGEKGWYAQAEDKFRLKEKRKLEKEMECLALSEENKVTNDMVMLSEDDE